MKNVKRALISLNTHPISHAHHHVHSLFKITMRFTLVALTVALLGSTNCFNSGINKAEAWISPYGPMLHRNPSTFMTRLNAKTIVEKDPKTSSVSVTITATAEQTRDAYDRVITDASKVSNTHTKLYTTYYSHNTSSEP